MTGRLADKIALVTGIGAGIGQGCALKFAREGATVVGCDINPDAAEATVADARAQGTRGGERSSVRSHAARGRRSIRRPCCARYGRIDVLLNAAAIAPHMARIAEIDYEKEWRTTIVGELDIVVLAVKAAWPWLVKSGRGAIINFSSVSSSRASLNFGMGPHCAGKAAVEALTRQLAVEGGPHNIRANTIAPGMIETAATRSAGALDGKVREAILARVAIKRLGQPEDIAACAAFLASDEASWITGANFAVDGGVTAV